MIGSSKLQLLEDRVVIQDLTVFRPEVIQFLRRVPEEERERIFLNAVELGFMCLERTASRSDLEFIRGELNKAIGDAEKLIKAIPGEVEQHLVAKIGTGEGQVLAPIMSLLDNAVSVSNGRIAEVKNLLANELDPNLKTSTICRVLQSVSDLLDPKQTGSIQCQVEGKLTEITKHDGAMSKMVREQIDASIAPLKTEIDKVVARIVGNIAVDELIGKTPLKGTPHELAIVESLQPWAKRYGASIEHVGEDGRPGDILIGFPSDPTLPKVVIEAKDYESTQFGNKLIRESIVNAMDERKAGAGLFVMRSLAGLAKEIGDWSEGKIEGRGPYIATTDANVELAIRWLICLARLDTLRATAPDVDVNAVTPQIKEIRTSLRRLTNIAKATGDICKSAMNIAEEYSKIKQEIQNALIAIEGALRVESPADPVEAPGQDSPTGISGISQ